MNKLIILSGPSCSGKSTKAKQLFDENPLNTIIINRDKIRELLYGYTEENVWEYYKRIDINSLEKQITQYETLLIKEGLASNKIVIVDATHLEPKYLERFSYFNAIDVVEINLYADLDVLIERNSNRKRKVDVEIIEKQLKKQKRLYTSDGDLYKHQGYIDYIKPFNNSKFPKCIVVDIDGTIAEKGDRSPYDWSKVNLDTPISEIIYLVNKYIQDEDYKVFFCSGRDEICRDLTDDWLMQYFTYYKYSLLMRKEKDQRPDWQIKKEMWEKICKEYYIEFMIDDRNQVVDYAKNLGFRVLQVEYNNF
jgi:predicted kinase